MRLVNHRFMFQWNTQVLLNSLGFNLEFQDLNLQVLSKVKLTSIFSPGLK